MSNFITIVTPDKTFPWQYTDPDSKVKLDTVFTLRIVPDDYQKVVREDNTRKGWDAGRRTEETEWDEFTRECLDYAIVGWEGLKTRNAAGEQVDVPCEREYKFLLPERVKAEIIRLTVGKEAGRAIEESRPMTSKERAQAAVDRKAGAGARGADPDR